MIECKKFHCSDYEKYSIENEINEFLIKNPNIKIITTNVLIHDNSSILIIFYKIKKNKIVK